MWGLALSFKVRLHKTLVRMVLMDPPLCPGASRQPGGRPPAPPAPCGRPDARSARDMHRHHMHLRRHTLKLPAFVRHYPHMCLGWSRIARRCSGDYVNDVLGPCTPTNPFLGVVPSLATHWRRPPNKYAEGDRFRRVRYVTAWFMIWRPPRRPAGRSWCPAAPPSELAHGQSPLARCVLVCGNSWKEVPHAGTGNIFN